MNYRGVFLTCKYAGAVMRRQGSGCIITVSSIFGQEPYPRVAAYSGTKAGVIALSQAFAVEMAPHSVRVNSIAPGYMATEMQWEGLRQRAAHAGITFEEERQRVWDLVPLGRHGSPKDMGALVAFLASDEAAYITGATFTLAGGVVRRLIMRDILERSLKRIIDGVPRRLGALCQIHRHGRRDRHQCRRAHGHHERHQKSRFSPRSIAKSTPVSWICPAA